MHLKNGAVLKRGEYRIEKLLGQGGFGITYMAIQTALDRKVAIKEFFMKDLCERDADTSSVTLGTSGSRQTVIRFKEKFIREAKTIASLRHSNIAYYLCFGGGYHGVYWSSRYYGRSVRPVLE